MRQRLSQRKLILYPQETVLHIYPTFSCYAFLSALPVESFNCHFVAFDSKACQRKLWSLVRHTAGLLRKRVEDLAEVYCLSLITSVFTTSSNFVFVVAVVIVCRSSFFVVAVYSKNIQTAKLYCDIRHCDPTLDSRRGYHSYAYHSQTSPNLVASASSIFSLF